MTGRQEIKRLNVRNEDDLRRLDERLRQGWRVVHMASFDTDTLLVVVIESPHEYGEASR